MCIRDRDFILKSNPLMQKLKKKFQILEPSLKDEGHLRSTGDALLLKRLFALWAAPMITVMVSRRREERINIRLDRLYLLCFFFEMCIRDRLNIDYNWGELNVYSRTSYEVEDCIQPLMAMSKGSAPEIEPDDIDVSDTVAFTWEIQ